MNLAARRDHEAEPAIDFGAIGAGRCRVRLVAAEPIDYRRPVGMGGGRVMRGRTGGASFGSRADAVIWPAIVVILAAGIGFSWNPTPMAQLLAAVFVVCGIMHAVISYGSQAALVFFATCVAVGFAMENIGVATGFPFGRYHFEIGADLPNVGRIPFIVGPMWFGAGYFSWIVAATLLGEADRKLDRRFNLIALPVVAAFVTAQWDLVVDPPQRDDRQGVDLARRRSRVRCAAFEFLRLAADLMAVLSGLCRCTCTIATIRSGPITPPIASFASSASCSTSPAALRTWCHGCLGSRVTSWTPRASPGACRISVERPS